MKISKTIKTVTQILETRKYWLRALSDVKKITSNQWDLHFYECLAEYVASLIYVTLYLEVVWAR